MQIIYVKYRHRAFEDCQYLTAHLQGQSGIHDCLCGPVSIGRYQRMVRVMIVYEILWSFLINKFFLCAFIGHQDQPVRPRSEANAPDESGGDSTKAQLGTKIQARNISSN